MPFLVIAGLALLLSIPSTAQLATVAETPEISPQAVSAQGLLRVSDRPGTDISPLGTTRLSVEAVAFAVEHWIASISVVANGRRYELTDLPGNGFLASDVSRIVALEAADTQAIPTAVRVYDLDGQLQYERTFVGVVEPALSADGGSLVFRHRDGIVLLDLVSLREEQFPHLQIFAAGPGQTLAGVIDGALVIFDGPTWEQTSHPLPPASGRPQRLDFLFSEEGPQILLLTGEVLYALEPADSSWQSLLTAPDGALLRDLAVRGKLIDVGIRRIEAGVACGERLTLDGSGRVLEQVVGEARAIPQIRTLTGPAITHAPIPWPLVPNAQHPVGNTYGEFQQYGGDPYMHPGIDVMSDPDQAVFAVRGGIVKSVLTTSGDRHWRIAIADQAGAGTTPGFLYAHVVESSIAWSVGDTVSAGDYLGDVVPWLSYDFDHLHFARIEDDGDTWDGSWLCIENPHMDLANQTESDLPFFEPISGDLLAFCTNETSNYLDPLALHGEVDIIAHVGDRIETDWVCTVQEIRYTIYPSGSPGSPLVDNKLAVDFDMDLDTYFAGPIDPFLISLLYKQDSVCPTQGDYLGREFYHVITNSNGDSVYEESDRWEAWDTTGVPNGDYMIVVRIKDVAGNTAEDSMLVTVVNNQPPVAICQDFSGPADEDCCLTVEVGDIDDGSYDPDGAGDIASLCITEVDGRAVGCLAEVEVCGAGSHSVTLTITDLAGESASCLATVWVQDITPPVLENVSVSKDSLWPSNHEMKDIGLSYDLTDNCDPAPVVSIGVTSDEPTATARGAGGPRHAPDAEIVGDTVLLRAERSQEGKSADGRVYVITVTATDASGNTASANVSVKVNLSKKKEAVDSGQNYDATKIN